jgi:hypothetical protein
MFRHEDEHVRVKLKDRAGPRREILAGPRKTTRTTSRSLRYFEVSVLN